MLHLASQTEPGWAAALRPHVTELLIDHAHCEKKAASTAVNLIFRYQPLVELMAPLSALAREELAHFELVLELLAERGETFAPRSPSPYASALYSAVRPEEPHRLLDTLLVCSLIEARSCERMRLLSEGLEDPQLVSLYGGLLASEARHHTTYVDLAVARFGRSDTEQRLGELAQHEAQILVQMPREPRMHSRAP
jgi:tRNA-(ms[2]io[6]A)-hydroxylase